MIQQLTSAISGSPATANVEPETIANVLSNKRRCRVIDILSDQHVTDIGELADKIATLEFGPDYTADQRKRVYVGVYQTHLDVLQKNGVIKGDSSSVRKGEAFAAYKSALEAIRDRSATSIDHGRIRADGGVCVDDADLPDWVPDEYDPDADLADRLRVAADVEGSIELHVADKRGVVEIVGEPVNISENPKGIRVYCGQSFSDWNWEIVVPKSDEYPARLEEADPHQDIEAYHKTRKTVLRDVDVRLYGVDDGRLTSDDVQGGGRDE